MMKRLIILLILLFCSCATGTTYYVATDGDNADSGSITEPWGTVAYALGASSALSAGDTLYLRGGTYREQVTIQKSGISNNWITVASYPGETAYMDGTEPLTGWTQAESDDAYLTVLGVVNTNYANIYWKYVEDDYFPVNISDTALFENRVMCRIASDPDQSVGYGEDTEEFRDVTALSDGQRSYLIDTTLTQANDYWNGAIIRVFLYGYNANVVERDVSDFVNADDKVVFDSDMPADLIFDASRQDRYRLVNHPHILDSAGEFYVGDVEDIGGTDYRKVFLWPIDAGNLTANIDMASRAFAFYNTGNHGRYLTIDNLTIRGTRSHGIYIIGGGREDYGSDLTISDCTIQDTGYTGIYMLYMDNATVDNCYVRRCGNRGIMGNRMSNSAFTNNDVDDTGSTNISFYNADTCMITNNALRGIRGGHGNGTSVYGEATALCEYILMAGNHYYNANMAFNDVRYLVVFGNLFDQDDATYAMTAWSSRYDDYQVWMNNTAPISTSYSLTLQDRNEGDVDCPRHYVVNNLLRGLMKGWNEPWNEYDPSLVVVEDRTYNGYVVYSHFQGAYDKWVLQAGEQDLRTTALTDIFVDPVFPGDYKLAESSPLISAGKNVQTILDDLGIISKFPDYDFTKDLDGNPWSSTPSIGCYEYADVTAPTPNPATFATPPAAVDNSSITMTATTATDVAGNTPVAYYFNETTGGFGGTDSGWQASPIYVDSGLSKNTEYTYTVQTRDSLENTGTASTAASATTTNAGDAIAPTPDPATWSLPPHATGPTSISMTSTTGIDEGGSLPPVKYQFVETGGGAGATNRAWQESPTYEDTGLTANTQYTYTVQMRDVVPNTGTASGGYSTYTSMVRMSPVMRTIINTINMQNRN